MTDRQMIAAMVYPMAQAVLFGAGLLLLMSFGGARQLFVTLPLMVVGTASFSIPLSYEIAPRLMARYWRHRSGDFISG